MPEVVPNGSSFTEFLILGFSPSEKQKVPLFLLFLLIYLFTVISNTLIIALISLDSNLHKPMYFFLCNMSCLDIFFTSVTAPTLLHMQLSEAKRISFRACMAQLYLFNSFGVMEYIILTAMAYDRYQAICNPLVYHQNMSRNVCCILAALQWGGGFIAALPINILISALCYCSSNRINHFFCDLTALLTLACNDTSAIEFMIFAEGVLIVLNCFLLTVTSYGFIGFAIIRISSSKGRFKAFSTCASHLTVVILFYTMIACLYMKPSSSYSLNDGKVLSVLNVHVIPMLNPVIYTLRNKDVREAVKNIYHFYYVKCLSF
ncbi:olfactory receptor 1019-like [Xenopus tropicalis]|uniref:Olfactory receptor n=1 Tax=Xenopus tropicalis TaxID=8364 RepID=A0A8J1JX69_XENTR|nr:olfactory receptor 1019-like [Xenopus tropicalis]